jgi:hypothetical protein
MIEQTLRITQTNTRGVNIKKTINASYYYLHDPDMLTFGDSLGEDG